MKRRTVIPTAEEAKRDMQKKLKPIVRQNDRNKLTSYGMEIGCCIFIILSFPFILFSITQAMAFDKSNDIQPISRIENKVITNTNHFNNQFKQSDRSYHDIQSNNIIKVKETLGSNKIMINGKSLVRHELPNTYYGDVDFSSFQPFMCYSSITNNDSPAWRVVNDKNSYTDAYGFRRHKPNKDQFVINGNDDYIIALGTFYKEKGMCGNRYLIVTTNGMYTAITGDEKSDYHTDEMNMFTTHNGKCGLIEWIVDQESGRLPKSILKSGTVTSGPIKVLKGKILYIYEIK